MTLTDILTGIKNWILAKFIPAQTGYITTTEKGLISQTFIDLVTTAGAAFNSESGYFELNGITDIPLDEMQRMYGAMNYSSFYGGSYYTNNSIKCRTNFPLFPYYSAEYFNHSSYSPIWPTMICCFRGNSTIEVAAIGKDDNTEIILSKESSENFVRATNLRRIIGILNVSKGGYLVWPNGSPWGDGYASLETIWVKGLVRDISFNTAPLLSNESILYMITNSAATSAITITLHPDAYARAIADEDIQAALDAHPLVTLVSA